MAGDVTDIIGLGKAAEKGIDVAAKFLEQLFGPAVSEVGEALADPIRNYRLRRQQQALAMLEHAKKLLDDGGLAPQAVPGRILFQILEHGSLEDDLALQGRWVALLANAAAPAAESVLPAYAEILRQLVPVQAAILDWLYAVHGDSISLEPAPIADAYEAHGHVAVHADAIIDRFGLTKKRYNVLASDLHRLQVIDGQRFESGAVGGGGSTSATNYAAITITPLGRAFVRACTPPKQT